MKSNIDLWTAPINISQGNLPLWYIDFFDTYEKNRYLQLKNELSQAEFFISHVLLREALTFAADREVEPYKWKFTENEYGKPELDSREKLPCLHFNLTHCNSLSVVAVSQIGPIGVDVEKLPCNLGSFPIDIVLSDNEKKRIRNFSSSVKINDFLKLWTIKEAYSKMLGKGISLDFRSFEVTLNPVRMVRTETGSAPPDDLYLETREIKIYGDFFHISLATKTLQNKKPMVLLHNLDSPLINGYLGNSKNTNFWNSTNTN